MSHLRLLLCLILCMVPASVSAREDGTRTLDECLQEVFAHNPGLARAKAEVQAKNSAWQGARKDLLPSLAMQYGYSKDLDAIPAVSPEENYHYRLSVEQPLYKGGALIAARDIQALGLAAAGQELKKNFGEVIVATHVAYYGVLQKTNLLKEARQAVNRLRSHQQDAKAFFEAGLIPKNDLLTSEVELAQGRQNLLASENNLALARAHLNILMGQPADAPLVVVEQERRPGWTGTWQEALEQAKKLRPEIEQSSLSIDQARQNVILARAPYLPALSLSASYKKQGDSPDLHAYPLGIGETRQALATMTWRFWAWGQRRAKVAEARHQASLVQEERELLVDRVTLEVRGAYLGVNQADENIKVTQKAVEQAEENYRLSESRYRAQITTSTEVLDAQTLLTRARNNYYNAQDDYNIATVRLEWAMGTLVTNLPGMEEETL